MPYITNEDKELLELITYKLSAIIATFQSTERSSPASGKVVYFPGADTRTNKTVIEERRSADEDLKLNKEIKNREVWTAKEVQNMPYLKDLHYRFTCDGLHQFRYRRDGYCKQFTSKNYEVAKKKAKDFLNEIKRKISEQLSSSHVDTVDSVAKLWFETKKDHVDAGTHRAYVSVYKNHIMPVFGNRRVSSILPMDLQPFFNELSKRLGKTAENSKVILNNIFNVAVANRLCSSNPMTAVIVDRHVRTPGKVLSDEQISRLKSILLESDDALATTYLIILYTGIRGAEIEKMTFDWDAGTFTVHNAKLKRSQRRNVENLTRTVPIFPALYLIKDRIDKDDWKFHARKVSDRFPDFWTENSVKDLRHTFVTKAREAGIENELVNLWTGHLPGQNVTANVYTHFSMKYQKQKAKKMPIY